jgi:tyrosinase
MGSLTKKKNKTANTGLDKARQIQPPLGPVITGPFEISINTLTSGAAYVGWTISSCSIRIANPPQPDHNVILKNRDTSQGGQVIFRTAYGAADQNTISLTLPGDGTPVPFFVGGKFGSASTNDQDGGISVTDAATSTVLHQRTLMVRVRKNANNLTTGERDRFLTAYAALNATAADYQVFLDSHNAAAADQIHHRPDFLPWHRAFVLSLERHLQKIDGSVAVHYWHFDQPSPNIFSADFMGGTPNSAGRLVFSPTNPLRNWAISGTTGVVRKPIFDTATSGAAWGSLVTHVATETTVLAGGPGFKEFRDMELDPHDPAHESFSTGPLISPATATMDPLFFLLHSNIDRLWAKWQWVKNLYDTSNPNTYSSSDPRPAIGDFLPDTMWPWNGITGTGFPDRPPTAPGGPLIQLAFPSKPGPAPTVADVIDYIGKIQGNSSYFDYDDVPLS